MEQEKLIKRLNEYECSHLCEGNHLENESVKSTIKADIDRQQLEVYLGKENKKEKRLYKMILYKLLNNLCSKYSQGMCEVAVVVVNAILKEAVMKNGAVEFINSDKVELFDGNEEEKRGFNRFCNINKEEYKKVEKSLHEIFKRTYEPLWKEELKLHKKYNEVFLRMMNERGVKVIKKHPLENLTHILTFFTRICRNENVIYRIYNIILNNDISVLYVLLILLYKYTDSETGSSSLKYDNYLKKLPTDFEEQVKKTIKEFLEMRKKIKNCKFGYFMMGVGISVVVAAGIALYNKKD